MREYRLGKMTPTLGKYGGPTRVFQSRYVLEFREILKSLEYHCLAERHQINLLWIGPDRDVLPGKIPEEDSILMQYLNTLDLQHISQTVNSKAAKFLRVGRRFCKQFPGRTCL